MISENIFSQRVKELRIANNMTQPQLGEAIGLSKQAINDIEQGRRETTIHKAVLLARLFNTTVEYLYGDSDEQTQVEVFMENLKYFSERLKSLRVDMRLKQEDIGKIISVSKTQISDIENGRRTTTIENLIALANYFNVSIDYLVGRTDNPEVNK